MSTFTTSALSTAFLEGAQVFGKKVLSWDIRDYGIQVRTNVKAPQALTKLTADGVPRPYRINEDYTGATFTDRILTVYQSKMDLQLDPEDLRNKYLATLPEFPFEQFAVQQASKQFLDAIYKSTLASGVRNGAGSAAADIADGWLTIIAAEITATNITPVATGAITSSNAVTQVEKVAQSVPAFMREGAGFRVLCSYDVFDKYKTHYRTLNGFGFQPRQTGQYYLDGINAVLQPAAWLGTSQRLIATVDGNLVFGTDIENVSMYPTPYLNYLKTRLMMPVGCQIADLDVLVVNDQA